MTNQDQQAQQGGLAIRQPRIIAFNGPPGFDFKKFANDLINSEYGEGSFNLPWGSKPMRPPIGPSPPPPMAENSLPVADVPFAAPAVRLTCWRPNVLPPGFAAPHHRPQFPRLPTAQPLLSTATEKDRPIAPLEFMMMSFNRVYEATRLIWMERLKEMAIPILRAYDKLRIHEAHCFNLGSFAKVIVEPFKPEENEPRDLAEWLITRLTQDEAIRVMTRYCIMIQFFELLTINGGTGVCEDYESNWKTRVRFDERWFAVHFSDERLLDEDIYVLRRFCKKLQDQRYPDGDFTNLAICPTNGRPPIPTNRPEGHQPGCHCADSKWNHFVYVADGKYEGLAGPNACRMPVDPAVFLAHDGPWDYKHTEGCYFLKPGQSLYKDQPGAVPKTNPEGGPLGVGMAVNADAIPQHLHQDNRYIKYCLHFQTQEKPVDITDLPRSMPPVLPLANALYIRWSCQPCAHYGYEFR
ncbi:hypothetical protein V8F20_010674 [Naviculisporaceae sp. PSN 640]